MLQAAYEFALDGAPVSCARYGNGHINETYLLVTADRRYILQKINRHVFRDVPALMRNIALVTRHLERLESDPRRALTLIETRDGRDYLTDENGDCWRVYAFIEGGVCLEQAADERDFLQSGVAFGRFQKRLSDFPADSLSETIPRFHDTVNRLGLLREAVESNAHKRLEGTRAELEFALERAGQAGAMLDMLKRGALKLRVTHNDTKLNNVMLDEDTLEPLCVIDLDTVMPGLAGNDFGDSIRFGASTATEDERDLSKVRLSLPHYRAYARGFLSACGDSLTQAEIDTLPLGAKLMTFECGIRFLTDHLAGDVYYRIHRPAHNLDRCRTQFKLVADMEKKWDAMREITAQEAEGTGI
ncbi:phosphotransferase enzyme family protein [Bacillota bacterium Meth-B3]